MSRIVPSLVTVILVGALVAGAAASEETPSIAGRWEGAWVIRAGVGGLVLHLSQRGEHVRGFYEADGATRGFVRVPVRGTVKDETLVLVDSNARRVIEGHIDGDTIAGTLWGKLTVKAFSVRRAPKPAERIDGVEHP